MAKATRARGKGNPLRRRVENRQTWVHLASCQNHRPRSESRPPMSKKRPTEVGATRGGPHHAPRFRPDQCLLSTSWTSCIRLSNKRKATAFSPGKRAFGTFAALGCAVFDAPCYGATVEETEQDQDENDIEDFGASSIKSLEGFAILDSGATKTILDS